MVSASLDVTGITATPTIVAITAMDIAPGITELPIGAMAIGLP